MPHRPAHPHMLPRRSVGLSAAVPVALLALLAALPVSHVVCAQPNGIEQQRQASPASASAAVKPVNRTRRAETRPGRSPIRLAALDGDDLPGLATLTEEEGQFALEQDLSLKVGKYLQVVDYPQEALRWRWTGTVLVEVLIAGNGLLKSVALSRTSGFRVLDEQALVVVRRVPKLYMPAGLRVRERTLTVPVGFYLQNL